MLQRNWAGNYQYKAATIHYPKTLDKVQELVLRANKIRALGTRHSFNDIADSSQDLISLEHLDHVVSLDKDRLCVTVEGGVRYAQLCQHLHQEGFALHNLASLPDISIAGACATATHGSGVKNGNLGTVVSAMEIVRADGKIVAVSREKDRDIFDGIVVSLGGFGVVTKLTLDIQPTFDVQQYVYENLPFRELEHHFDDIVSGAFSVSLFTDWKTDAINQVWLKQRATEETKLEVEPTYFGATLATRNLHPIAQLSAENCTEQMGVPGPWHERLPHFRIDHTPSSGEELQSEYFVPREYAFKALSAIRQIREQITPLLQISEIRTIAADGLWMSPCYQQDCMGIHFTWIKNQSAVQRLLPMIEEVLMPFEVRPHWGKLFMMSARQLRSRYKKLNNFRQLLLSYDPQGKFWNAFLDRYIFSAM